MPHGGVAGGQQTEAPTARIEPRTLTVQEGQEVEFVCVTTGSPTPRITWSAGPGRQLAPDVVVDDAVLRIPSVRSIHEGPYYCDAENSAGSAQIRTILYVTGQA